MLEEAIWLPVTWLQIRFFNAFKTYDIQSYRLAEFKSVGRGHRSHITACCQNGVRLKSGFGLVNKWTA